MNVKDTAYPYERYVELFKAVWPGLTPDSEHFWYERLGREARARSIKLLVSQQPLKKR
jgi:hypothetical protein